jgi:hypothetical protein
MNTKPLLYLSCLLAATFSTSTINAGQHRGGGGNAGNRVASRSGGVTRSFAGGGNRFAGSGNRFVSGGNRGGNWNGQRFNSGQHFVGNRNFNRGNWNANHWNGQHWSGQHFTSNHWNNNWNWHHHHHHGSSVVFFDVGFPFWGWWGYPYYYDSGYYPYGYGYYPYGSSYGYGSGYYGSYNYDYGNQNGYDNGYGNGYSNHYDAKVAELQRRLANAGYYRGEIDGIWGSRTQYALKAYHHDHPDSEYGSNGHSPTLRNTPYSPPPTTTEPSE